MGADLNGFTANDSTPLHFARDIDILQAFLARGADPARLNWGRYTPINCHVCNGNIEAAVYLLQDPRVRASVNVLCTDGEIALHHVACHLGDEGAAFIASLLLQAGANPNLKDRNGRTPLAKAQEEHPSYHATIALLDKAMREAGKTSLLVKARRLIVAAASSAVVPSYLEGRMARDEPLPRVTFTPLTGGQNDEEGLEDRELRTLLAFTPGIDGGPKGDGMPREVFRHAWHPLRYGVVGLELQLQD